MAVTSTTPESGTSVTEPRAAGDASAIPLRPFGGGPSGRRPPSEHAGGLIDIRLHQLLLRALRQRAEHRPPGTWPWHSISSTILRTEVRAPLPMSIVLPSSPGASAAATAGSSSCEPLRTIRWQDARVAASSSSTVATRLACSVGPTASCDRSPRTAPARWMTISGRTEATRSVAAPGWVRSQIRHRARPPPRSRGARLTATTRPAGGSTLRTCVPIMPVVPVTRTRAPFTRVRSRAQR